MQKLSSLVCYLNNWKICSRTYLLAADTCESFFRYMHAYISRFRISHHVKLTCGLAHLAVCHQQHAPSICVWHPGPLQYRRSLGIIGFLWQNIEPPIDDCARPERTSYEPHIKPIDEQPLALAAAPAGERS